MQSLTTIIILFLSTTHARKKKRERENETSASINQTSNYDLRGCIIIPVELERGEEGRRERSIYFASWITIVHGLFGQGWWWLVHISPKIIETVNKSRATCPRSTNKWQRAQGGIPSIDRGVPSMPGVPPSLENSNPCKFNTSSIQ